MIEPNDPNESTKVTYNKAEYTGIRQIGFSESGSFVISLFDHPLSHDKTQRGGLFTTIGISSKEWRKKYSCKDGYKIISPTHLIIFNNYGDEYSLQIEDEAIIQQLIDECKSHDLIAY